MSTKKTLFGFFKLNDEGIKFKLYRPEITFPQKTKLEKFPDETIIEIGSNAYDAFVDGFIDIISNNELMPVDELSDGVYDALDNLFTTTYELVEEDGDYYGKEATILLQLVQEDKGPLKDVPTLRTKVRIGQYRPAPGNVIVRLEDEDGGEPVGQAPEAMTAGMWAVSADDGGTVNLVINSLPVDGDPAAFLDVLAYIDGVEHESFSYPIDDIELGSSWNIGEDLQLVVSTEYEIRLRLRNQDGSSDLSDTKVVTPFN